MSAEFFCSFFETFFVIILTLFYVVLSSQVSLTIFIYIDIVFLQMEQKRKGKKFLKKKCVVGEFRTRIKWKYNFP